MSLTRWRVVVGAVMAAGLLWPAGAGADWRDDERTEIVQRQLALAEELDELAASDDELADALETLDLWIGVQTAEVDHTQAVLAEATIAAERSAAAEEAKAAEIDDLESLMATMAVNAYVQPPSADHLATLKNSAAPADAARISVYLDVKSERDTDLVQQLRQAREQLGRLTQRTRATEERAQAARDEAASTLEDLAVTRERFGVIHDEVLARQAGATYESEIFALALDRSNRHLIAQASTRPESRLPLTSVRGIRVHQSIAGQLEMLLAAAEADGIVLGGGGFRTHAEQIELRRLHCGEEQEAIYEMPSSECSPPTARPGNSMHEIGLAVDFTYNGTTISNRNSAAFRWLADNADIYGLHNLPSEPWHWSLNGS